MLKLELSTAEQEALALVLKSFLSELRNEVGHTDRFEYREVLKNQEHALKLILSKLERS